MPSALSNASLKRQAPPSTLPGTYASSSSLDTVSPPAAKRLKTSAEGGPSRRLSERSVSGSSSGSSSGVSGAIRDSWKALALIIPGLRKKIIGEDGHSSVGGGMANGDARPRKGKEKAAQNDADPEQGLAGELEDMSLGSAKHGPDSKANGIAVPKIYPPLPPSPVSMNGAEPARTQSIRPPPTKWQPQYQLRPSPWYNAQEAERAEVPPPGSVASVSTTGTTLNGGSRPKSRQRNHILNQQHLQRVSSNRKLTVENARQPVGRKALLPTPASTTASTSLSVSRGTTVTGDGASPIPRSISRPPSVPGSQEGGDIENYRTRLERMYQSFNQTVATSTTASIFDRRKGKEPAGRGKDGLDVAIKKARASRDSPLPAEPSLPAFEKLSLRAKQLDRTFARPRPKLRAFRRALSPDEQLVVKRALATDGEVSSLPGAFVEGKDVQRLLPGRWLNDEITTFYGVLINRRADEADKKGELEARGLLRVHCFSSFFMNTYGPKGHAGVKKWTKKTDLFAKDMVIFPLNLSNVHWVCAAVNLRQRRFEFYDSMGSRNYGMLKKLRSYIAEEHEAKKGAPLDLSDWEDYFGDEDLPQQDNGCDCGVFVCQFMECLSRSWKGADTIFDFTAKNMPYVRSKMIYELVTKQLVPEEWA